jgi:hypothetical protein
MSRSSPTTPEPETDAIKWGDEPLLPCARNQTRTADLAEGRGRSFWKRGFVILRGVFTREEMGILKDIITRHADMQKFAERAKERSAGTTRPSFETIYVWNDTARKDAFAKATRSRKITDRLEAIFDDEVYVYHNKIALKYPGVVGFSYHQDYWYWVPDGEPVPRHGHRHDRSRSAYAGERLPHAGGGLAQARAHRARLPRRRLR